ncbi:hypothetical protein BJY01DRAFT_248662 [Aspergillus pseudoustus]|uniref:Uncharacterized protein n=1 Tax=Aspergillus pseudoustus TaxID=1810923 RepID=A0ABR4JUW0_9EURO
MYKETREQCAQTRTQDADCYAMVWSGGVCWQSAEEGAPEWDASKAVLMTSAALEKERNSCLTEKTTSDRERDTCLNQKKQIGGEKSKCLSEKKVLDDNLKKCQAYTTKLPPPNALDIPTLSVT